jgi:hypothetical protein
MPRYYLLERLLPFFWDISLLCTIQPRYQPI